MLSPILFIIFIDNLKEKLANYNQIVFNGGRVNMLMYADDIVLLSNSIEDLQNLFDELYDYCALWKLNLNMVKTKILICKTGRIALNEVWFWGDQYIDRCDNYKYLGVFMYPNGITHKSLCHIRDQANLAVLQLHNRLKTLGIPPINIAVKIFDTCITPILVYASQVWGCRNCTVLERIYLRYLKRILGVRLSTGNCAVYAELGVIPFDVLVKFNLVKYWTNVIEGEEESLIYRMYCFLRHNIDADIQTGCFNWAKSVKSILYQCGFYAVWDTHSINDKEGFLQQLKVCLYDHSVNDIMANLSRSP